MLGSVHDADDAVQETLLAAWRGLGGFEGRSSLRSWLYQIATSRMPAAGRGDSAADQGTGSSRPSMARPGRTCMTSASR